MSLCYLALGSNLHAPYRQLARALRLIRQLPRSHLQKQSRIYATKAIGVRAQPDYLNMVIALQTHLSPKQLLAHCHHIEDLQLRVRKKVWGARTIDIDILLFDNKQWNLPHLTIPHPQMLYRDFVITPLLDIAPDLYLPNGDPLIAYTMMNGPHIRENRSCTKP